MPHDLQIALHDDPEVGGVFEALPYSHEREQVDWILEAKRPKTRARRIDEALRINHLEGADSAVGGWAFGAQLRLTSLSL